MRRGYGALALTLFLLSSSCREAAVEKPVPLFDHVPIQYPISLWDQDVEGRTVIRVWVDTAGLVDSAEVAESSGQAAFDSAALEGGRRLRFRPATRDGEPVSVWARVPVEFSKHPPKDSSVGKSSSGPENPSGRDDSSGVADSSGSSTAGSGSQDSTAAAESVGP